MNTETHRVRTVEVVHLLDGLWSSTAFIHRGQEPDPIKILLHAGKSRERWEARELALTEAEKYLATIGVAGSAVYGLDSGT